MKAADHRITFVGPCHRCVAKTTTSAWTLCRMPRGVEAFAEARMKTGVSRWLHEPNLHHKT